MLIPLKINKYKKHFVYIRSQLKKIQIFRHAPQLNVSCCSMSQQTYLIAATTTSHPKVLLPTFIHIWPLRASKLAHSLIITTCSSYLHHVIF